MACRFSFLNLFDMFRTNIQAMYFMRILICIAAQFSLPFELLMLTETIFSITLIVVSYQERN